MKNSIQMIDRPPRIQPELPFNRFEIPTPPENPQDGVSKLIQVAMPMTMIVGYVFVTMFGGRGGGSGALILNPHGLIGVGIHRVLNLFVYSRKAATPRARTPISRTHR